MKDKTYEVCPYCGEEVELNAELKVQKCPHCGKHIVTCSMCRALSEGVANCCKNCPLEYLAHKTNDEDASAYTIAEQAEKVAKFLKTTESYKSREVCFEPSTYDHESDMPHYKNENGESLAVSSAVLNDDGTFIGIDFLHESNDGACGVGIDLTEGEDEDYIESGIDEILREMFYYTNESYNYEDYEEMLTTIE